MINANSKRYRVGAGTLFLFFAVVFFQLIYCVLYYPSSKNFTIAKYFFSENDETIIDYSILRDDNDAALSILSNASSDQSILNVDNDDDRDRRKIRNPDETFFQRKHSFDCRAIFDNDTTEAGNATEHKRPLKSEFEMSKIFASCSTMRRRHHYPSKPASESEAGFPLAYVLLLNEHLEQIEILFNSIYAPQNSYCFHVDLKAPHLIHYAVKKLATCFPDQVFLSERAPLAVSRESSKSLHAIVHCFDRLFSLKRRPWWKYAFIIQGHDFPLRTNRELVEILKLHDGMNDVELTHGQKERYESVFEETLDDLGQPSGLEKKVKKRKAPIPDDRLTIYKGNIASTLSRQFVEFVLKNNVSRSLLSWFDQAFMPDELYFSTLNHNEILNPPGGYPGKCVNVQGLKPWVSRFSIWMWYSDKLDEKPKHNYTCRSEYRNSVCLLSCADLPMLSTRPELFMNKFWITKDPVAVDCMHERLYNRTVEASKNPRWKLPHLNYYNSLAGVQFRKWRLVNPRGNSSEFTCVACQNCEH